MNQLLFLVYALLGLAIIIAVLGIVGLALSVLERTREIGLLRAVGLSSHICGAWSGWSRLRSPFSAPCWEWVWGSCSAHLQRSQAGEGLEVLAVPWVQLVVFVLLAGVVGVLAALWPAHRAARLDVLRAITTE